MAALEFLSVIIESWGRGGGVRALVNFINLIKYFLKYGIFIVEQDDEYKFNRGKLLNIGAIFALDELRQKCGPFLSQTNLCLIFHDVDMIPLNNKIPYNCSERYS